MSSFEQGFYSRFKISPGMMRHIMNWWSPFLGMRIQITRIATDWRKVSVLMKLSMRNENAVGSHLGGGLFSMTDPFFMLMMMMNALGRDYVVWDKAATIQFVTPGRGTVFAHFMLGDEELAEVREKPKKVKNLSRSIALMCSIRSEKSWPLLIRRFTFVKRQTAPKKNQTAKHCPASAKMSIC